MVDSHSGQIKVSNSVWPVRSVSYSAKCPHPTLELHARCEKHDRNRSYSYSIAETSLHLKRKLWWSYIELIISKIQIKLHNQENYMPNDDRLSFPVASRNICKQLQTNIDRRKYVRFNVVAVNWIWCMFSLYILVIKNLVPFYHTTAMRQRIGIIRSDINPTKFSSTFAVWLMIS